MTEKCRTSWLPCTACFLFPFSCCTVGFVQPQAWPLRSQRYIPSAATWLYLSPDEVYAALSGWMRWVLAVTLHLRWPPGSFCISVCRRTWTLEVCSCLPEECGLALALATKWTPLSWKQDAAITHSPRRAKACLGERGARPHLSVWIISVNFRVPFGVLIISL